MVVHVEDAPNFVISQERITPTLRFPLRLLLSFGSVLDRCLWAASAVVDPHLDEPIAERRAQRVKVSRLRAAAFAKDENPLARGAARLGGAQIPLPPTQLPPGELPQ